MNRKVFFRRMMKSKLFLIGLFGIIFVAAICYASPYFIAHDPLDIDLPLRLEAPDWSLSSSGHFFGTDSLGRDVLSRLLIGGKTSLTIAISVVIITTIIGMVLGLIAGYFGGVADLILMRICDIMMAVPSLLLAICVIAILGGTLALLSLLFVVRPAFAAKAPAAIALVEAELPREIERIANKLGRSARRSANSFPSTR